MAKYDCEGGPVANKRIKVGFKHMHQPMMADRPSKIKKIQPDKSVGAGKRGREY